MTARWTSVALMLAVTSAAAGTLLAQTPAPLSPGSQASTAEQEIRAALTAYWRAIAEHDLDTYRRLRPDLAPGDLEQVRRAFAQPQARVRPSDEVVIESIEVVDDRAEVRCRPLDQWRAPENRDPVKVSVIRLRRTPDGWVISTIR